MGDWVELILKLTQPQGFGSGAELGGIFLLNDFCPPPPSPVEICAKIADWLIYVTCLNPPYSSALRVAVRFAALRFSIVTPLYCFRRKQ